ncbi:putative short-chain dehydrogenase [Phaeomoniella chlamydospora]|uniref:Putative short-chain dehydrogenase n=1 Tax=Phaeomoniella chlamydospora TaxID=158046 RepID=A0A0G2GSI7_PHACM|nr:putative short-chain dehydrogenase [Phaeomoniella chlamydospora]
MAPVPTLSFKCALITGGAGGLGKAMATDLVKMGKKVIIAGRTESKLQSTAKEIGAAAYYVLDTGDIPSLEAFVRRITEEHPELDCLINNAGVQRPFQVLGPDYDFDLSKADQEININIRGPLHLCVLLVQDHFKNLSSGAVIINVSSVLGFNPFSVINPVYNGTKAWLHFFTTNLRTQLSQADSKIKVVEIAPPSVETDLHRERVDPDDNKKSKGASALSVEEFMEEVKRGWEENVDTIGPGMAGKQVAQWDDTFGKIYKEMTG